MGSEKSAPAQAATKAAVGKKSAGKSTDSGAKKKTGAAPRKISPRQALKNTRALLEAKHERDRNPPPWQALGATHHTTVPHAGFQSDEARDQAVELHKGEMDLDAIQGNVSSRDRGKQGKRDNR